MPFWNFFKFHQIFIILCMTVDLGQQCLQSKKFQKGHNCTYALLPCNRRCMIWSFCHQLMFFYFLQIFLWTSTLAWPPSPYVRTYPFFTWAPLPLKNYDWKFEIQASIVFLYIYLFQLWYLQYNYKRLATVTQIYPYKYITKNHNQSIKI